MTELSEPKTLSSAAYAPKPGEIYEPYIEKVRLERQDKRLYKAFEDIGTEFTKFMETLPLLEILEGTGKK